MKEGIVDEYSVRTVRDRKTKNRIGEYWDKIGVGPHRVFGPAHAEFDADGHPLREIYYLHGEAHRPENAGPAVIIWSPETHRIVYEEFRFHGEIHRTGNRPAIIGYDPYSGRVINREYCEHGKRKSSPDENPDISP